MAVKFTDTKYYQQIADAIRAKTGSTLTMTPSEMATEIGNIPAGGDDNLVKRLNGTEIELTSNDVTQIVARALYEAPIKKLIIPKCKTIAAYGMYHAHVADGGSLDLSGVETIENYGLAYTRNGLYVHTDGLGVEELDLSSCKTIGDYAMQYCGSYVASGYATPAHPLKRIIAPVLESAGNRCFYMGNETGTTATLESVDLPALKSLGSSCFQNQTALKKVSLGSRFFSMGSYAFSACTSLVEFECSTTLESNIGEAVLGYNPALEYADLGGMLTFDRSTFINDTALKYVISRRTNRRMNPTYGYTSMFTGSGITASTGWILVPSAQLEDYKTNWSNFASRFVALEDYTVDGTTTGEIDREKLKTLA